MQNTHFQQTKTCSKLALETLEKGVEGRSGVFIVLFEHIKCLLGYYSEPAHQNANSIFKYQSCSRQVVVKHRFPKI